MSQPSTSARAWKVLAVTSFASFMGYLDTTVVNVAFPDLERSFEGATREGLAWVLDGYAIVLAALLVPAGRYADALGRKRVLIAGVALFTLASALCALAQSPGQLVAFRLIQAVGAAMSAPAGLSLVLPEFGPERRALAVGIWGGSAALASALGPPLGGLLVEAAGWQMVFLINLPIGALAIYLARRVLVDSRDPDTTRPDMAGALVLAGALALIALGITRGEAWGWGDTRTVAAFAAAALAGIWFVRRSYGRAGAALDLELFRIPSFAAANAATVAFAVGFFGLLLVEILFLTSVWGYGVLSAGLAIAPGPLSATVFAAVAGRIADARGFRIPTILGAGLFVAGALWLVAAAGPEPNYLGVWLPAMLVIGAGIGFAMPTHAAAATAALPATRYATGSAINGASRQFGAVIGFAVAVALVGTPGPAEAAAAFDRGFMLGAVAGAVSMVACLGLGVRAAAAPAVAPGPAAVARP